MEEAWAEPTSGKAICVHVENNKNLFIRDDDCVTWIFPMESPFNIMLPFLIPRPCSNSCELKNNNEKIKFSKLNY